MPPLKEKGLRGEAPAEPSPAAGRRALPPPCRTSRELTRSPTERCRSSLPSRQLLHDVPLEPDEPMQLRFENPLLVAVRAEPFRGILRVRRRLNPIALNS